MEKLSKTKQIFITTFIVVMFLSFLIPVRFANAACAPRVSVFKATPLETSKEKPKVKITINVTNLNPCTTAEKNDLILYISADGVDSDVNLPSPLEYLYNGNQNDFTLPIDFEDPFEPQGKTERLNWPAISYKAYIAKKGRVTTVGDVVSTYETPVTFKNLSYVQPGGQTPPIINPPATTPSTQAGYASRNYDGFDWEGSLQINNPSGKDDIAGLVTKLINWLLLILAMVATIIIIISGLMLVFNSGNESIIKKAKSSITWAIIGLIVTISAFAIINIVQSLL